MAFLTLTMLFGSSCNKDFPNTLRSEYPNDTANVALKQKKVLYILLDGVRGNAIKTLSPPNLAQIVRKSIYTYDGLADFTATPITNASGWATALTSVSSNQHKVVSENFAGNQIANFPTIFTKFKQLQPKLRTASIVASKAINDYLAVDATFKANFENDDLGVKTAAINELKNENASIVLAQFHSAELAGMADNYTDASIPYTNAITQLDTYVGELMTALAARPNILKEDWMVVIASNKGGTVPVAPADANFGAYSDPAKNNLIIFYNPRFVTQIAPRPDATAFPYSGYAPTFIPNSSTAGTAISSNTAIGNFGTSGEFTLMFKLRDNALGAQYYPHFFGKRPGVPYDVVANGWGFLFGGNDYQFDYGGTPRIGGGTVRDGLWHTIAIRISMVGSSRILHLFTDGVLKNPAGNAINTKSTDNTAPMRIGGDINSGVNINMKDLALYNVAFSDADLIAAMRKEILPGSPKFANLLSWWPANESTGNIIEDKSGNGNNFTIVKNVTRVPFNDVSPNVSPEITESSYRVVINSVDIPFQIYQWMGVIVPSTWMLEGKTWKPTYTDVRNN